MENNINVKNDLSALEYFYKTRNAFAVLFDVLICKCLVKYEQCGEHYSLVLGEELAKSIMINGLPTGVHISIPDELRAIVNCELDFIKITRDAIILGMHTLYVDQGDARILNIVIPTTHAMAQHLRDCKTVDIGRYKKSEYKFELELNQYFEPEYEDVSLFSIEGLNDNWVQLTALGGECLSLEEQGIDIDSDYDVNMKLLEDVADDTKGEIDEFYRVALSIKTN